MAIVTFYSDLDLYAFIDFDRDQIERLCGDHHKDRFDFLSVPRSYKDVITETLRVNFSDSCGGLTGKNIPDLMEFRGKLFLSQKAYDAVAPIIDGDGDGDGDGEFFQVAYEEGSGYIFNPLKTAESVEALDPELCIKNDWDEVENVGFFEDRLKGISVFRSAFDGYNDFYCQEAFKRIVEESGLKGLIFSQDLGGRFGSAQNQTH